MINLKMRTSGIKFITMNSSVVVITDEPVRNSFITKNLPGGWEVFERGANIFLLLLNIAHLDFLNLRGYSISRIRGDIDCCISLGFG